jgi:hypothetical protein
MKCNTYGTRECRPPTYSKDTNNGDPITTAVERQPWGRSFETACSSSSSCRSTACMQLLAKRTFPDNRPLQMLNCEWLWHRHTSDFTQHSVDRRRVVYAWQCIQHSQQSPLGARVHLPMGIRSASGTVFGLESSKTLSWVLCTERLAAQWCHDFT